MSSTVNLVNTTASNSSSTGKTTAMIPAPRKLHERPLIGTTEGSKMWFVLHFTGLLFVLLFYSLFAFSSYALLVLHTAGYILDRHLSRIAVLMGMSLVCHVAVMFTDPGAIPTDAHALPVSHSLSPDQRKLHKKAGSRNFCRHCDCYIAPKSHHDRISNRCIARMDHYCPWTNNAIGAKNQKQYLLFLAYTYCACWYLLLVVSSPLFYCNSRACIALYPEAVEQLRIRQSATFSVQSVPASIPGWCGAEQQQLDPSLLSSNVLGSVVLTAVSAAADDTASPWLLLFLSRAVAIITVLGICFTGSMLLNQVYCLLSGLGNIDRKKLRLRISTPIRIPMYRLDNIFGVNWWFWLLPVSPQFAQKDKVLHYRIIPGLQGSLKAGAIVKMANNGANAQKGVLSPIGDPSSGELSSGASSAGSPRNIAVASSGQELSAVAGVVVAGDLLTTKGAVKTAGGFATADPAVVEEIEKHRRRSFAGKMKHTAMVPVRMTSTMIGTVSDGVKNMLPPQQARGEGSSSGGGTRHHIPVFGKIMREKQKRTKKTSFMGNSKKENGHDGSDGEHSDIGPEDTNPPRGPFH